MHVSFVDKLIKTSVMPVHFMRCKDGAGKDCYFFLTAPAQKLAALKRITGGEFDLREYGQIIACGFGRNPDPETIEQLKEKYQIDATQLIQG